MLFAGSCPWFFFFLVGTPSRWFWRGGQGSGSGRPAALQICCHVHPHHSDSFAGLRWVVPIPERRARRPWANTLMPSRQACAGNPKRIFIGALSDSLFFNSSCGSPGGFFRNVGGLKGGGSWVLDAPHKDWFFSTGRAPNRRRVICRQGGGTPRLVQRNHRRQREI